MTLRNVDVVLRTPNGSLTFNVDADDRVMLPLVGQYVLGHHQLQGLLDQLDLSQAETLVLHTPGKLRGRMPPGLTTVLEDGVSINEPLLSDVPMSIPVDQRIALDRLFQNSAVIVNFMPGQRS